jgi:hypothetical protein
MTTALVMRGMVEELQAYIGANSGLGYVVGDGGNATVEDSADVQDLIRMGQQARILLTLFEEGGTLIPGARRTGQERSIRFATVGDSGQEALDRAHDLNSWLWNQKCFATDGFRILVLRVPRPPQVVLRGASGSHVADFVVTFLTYNRP